MEMQKWNNEKNRYLLEDFKILVKNIEFLKDFYNKTFLITGATGLIGSLLVKFLYYLNDCLNANITIIAQIRDAKKANQIFNSYLSKDLKFIVCDLEHFECPYNNIDYIVHTASPTASRFFITYPVETMNTLYLGTKNVLDFAVKDSVRSVIYLSSMEVFGVVKEIRKLREEDLGYIDINNVRSSYSEGKRICELLSKSYAEEYGVNVKIARLAQVFGAGVNCEENRVFAQFARSILNHNDIVLHTNGNSIGNYCYTRDVISAIFYIIKYGEIGECYTVVNEENSISIKAMAEKLASEIANDEISVIIDIPQECNYGYAPETKIYLSSNKIEQLGWKPTVSLIDMYKRMLPDFMENDKGYDF